MDGVRVDDSDVTYSPGVGAYLSMKYHSDLLIQVGQNVEGRMDKLVVWNRVLTPEEVANISNV